MGEWLAFALGITAICVMAITCHVSFDMARHGSAAGPNILFPLRAEACDSRR
jgi:hypothetical protein